MEENYLDDLLWKQDDEDEFEKKYKWDSELDEWIVKGRVYVSDPSEVPEGQEVQEGDQGGYFYETGEGGGQDPSGGDGSGDMGQYIPEEPTMTGLEQTLQDQGLDEEMTQEVVGHVLEIQDALDDPSHPRHEEALQMGFDEQVREALEASGVTGGGGEPPADDSSGGGGGEGAESGGGLDLIEEPYRSQLDSDFAQEAAQTLLDADPEIGAEYVHEALHQDGDYFDSFDSIDEVVEDFELYQEMR